MPGMAIRKWWVKLAGRSSTCSIVIAAPPRHNSAGKALAPRAARLSPARQTHFFSIAMTLSRPPFALLRILALAMLLLANTVHAAMTVMHGFADYTSVLLWIQ